MKTLLAIGLIALTAAAEANAATCGASTFVSGKTLGTVYQPTGVVVGDFDGDGHADIVVTTYSNELRTFLGNGDGTFASAVDSASTYAPYSAVVAGTFNAGSDLDVAFATNGSIAVQLGNGDGSFQAPVTFPADPNPSGLVAVDLTGDGKVDLVESGSQGVLVLVGAGNGTFAAPVVYSTSGPAQGITFGDFDSDGKLDVAVTVAGGVVDVFFGTVGGILSGPVSIKVGAQLGAIVAADLNDDGKLDLALSAQNYLGVLRGNGDGTFRAAIEYPSTFALGAIAAADLDGDGRTDIAALRGGGYYGAPGVVMPFLQRDGGTLELGSAYLAGLGSASLAIGDFDEDTVPDIVTTDYNSYTATVLFGETGGRLAAPTYTPLQTAPLTLVSGDFDEDGRVDLAAMGSNYDGPLQIVSVVDGVVSMGAPIELDSQPQSAATADLNGDGHLDLVIAVYYSGLRVLFGNGDGTFQPPVGYTTGYASRWVVAGDFTGDGAPDVALVDQDQSSSQWEIAVLLNDGAGNLVPGSPIPIGHQLNALVAAHLHPGPTLDLAATNGDCCNPPNQVVFVMRGNGDGTFQAPASYPAGPSPAGLVAADFNGDEALDMAVADSGANSVALLMADGAGGFQPAIFIAVGGSPYALAASDFDIDGKTDLMTLNTSNVNASLLLGTGDGGFQAPVLYPSAAGATVIQAVHFGGQGADVAIAGSGDFALELLFNTHRSVQTLYAKTVLLGGQARFAASASGLGPLSYQWKKDGVPLVDGGSVSGALTATLTIEPASFADLGAYGVDVTDACGTTSSNAAPLYVEFADVPTSSPFHGDIIAIATAGITGGCGGANYCPTSPVRRDQMAAFLLKAEHGSAYVPPGCTGVFTDVPCPSAFADWVEQLAAEGVTGGCGGGNYCPDQSVTRAQMAVFLLKTSQGSSYTPPPATGIFGDVPVGSFAADFIEDLYNRGITGGCSVSPLLYCPGSTVLRQQMATFLSRTFLP